MPTPDRFAVSERTYSNLIETERGEEDLKQCPDVQLHLHHDYPLSLMRLTSGVNRAGPYRIATLCLTVLCAILLISIIALSANNRSKPSGSDEGTSLMQTDVSALKASVDKLQRENNELRDERDDLLSKMDADLTTKASPVVGPTAKATRVPPECYAGWHFFNHSCYLITTVFRSWSSAQTYCLSKGAHLAIIHTAEEQTFLWDLLPRAHWNTYWFGITDGETEDVWKWVDGTTLEKDFWEAGEPNNHINEDCGYIVKTEVLERVATSSWYDAPCHMSLKFICEKELSE